MESAGVALISVGIVNLIYPGIYIRFSKDNPVKNGKMNALTFKKWARFGGAISVGIGFAFLWAANMFAT